MKEQSTEATFEIIENNELILVAKAEKDGVNIAVEYYKPDCKKDGIDFSKFRYIYYPKDDVLFLNNLKNELNKWLRENHIDKFN